MARRKVNKRADNRFEKKITIGKDMSGKPIRKSFYSLISQADADKKAEQYKIQMKIGKVSNENIKLKDWSIDWLETYKKGQVSFNTYESNYKPVIYNHIIPFFNDIKLSEITPFLLQKYFNSKNHLSKSTLSKHRITLYSIFDKAMDAEYIHNNPMKNVKIPECKPTIKKDVWSLQDSKTVIDFAKTHSNGLGALILLKTGLRRGELLGLRWEDFDFEGNILHIQRNVIYKPKDKDGINTDIVDSNKIKNHNRYIPFDNELKQYLLRYKKESGFVLSSGDNPVTPDYFSRQIFAKFMKDLTDKHPNIPKRNPHELRHTYGTLLREKEVDIYTISRVMGHSDISTTEKIYVKNKVDVLKKAMEKFFIDK